uniref:Uncharacterized protein n=1 Tax=mine drainage metagenome TaxID=410659 RepID=E6QLA0_9ZZZZ
MPALAPVIKTVFPVRFMDSVYRKGQWSDGALQPDVFWLHPVADYARCIPGDTFIKDCEFSFVLATDLRHELHLFPLKVSKVVAESDLQTAGDSVGLKLTAESCSFALRRGGENRKKPNIFRLLFSFSVFRLIFQVIENRLFILFFPG